MSAEKPRAVQARSVEELVATYAPAGVKHHQDQRQRGLARAMAGLAVAAGLGLTGYAALETGPSPLGTQFHEPARTAAATRSATAIRAAAVDAELARAATLQAELAVELAAIREQREELRNQRAAMTAQQAELASELNSMSVRRAALQEQQDKMARQSAQLAASIAAMETDRGELLLKQQQLANEGPALDAEIQAMNQRRQNLDDERKRFRAQRELLQHELNLLNEQRTTLENQQQELQEQWLALQEMLDKVAAGRRQSQNEAIAENDTADAQISAAEPAGDVQHDAVFPEPELLMASSTQSIGSAELGEIRGGFDIDGDLDIAIGLTRSVNINGIEEYSSRVNLGDLSSGQFRNVNIQPVLIQNGSGNTVATSALGAPGNSIPVFIQNTLDNQRIVNTNVYDVTVSNFAGRSIMRSVDNAISESLIFQN